jgi:hypothetical protein
VIGLRTSSLLLLPALACSNNTDVVASDAGPDQSAFDASVDSSDGGAWCPPGSTFCDSFDDRTDPKGLWDSLVAPSAADGTLALDGVFSLTPPHAAHIDLATAMGSASFTKLVNGKQAVIRFAVYIQSLGSLTKGVQLASMISNNGSTATLRILPSGVETDLVCTDPNVLGCGPSQVYQTIVTGKWIEAYLSVGPGMVFTKWDPVLQIAPLTGAMGSPSNSLGTFASITLGATPDAGETLAGLEIAFDNVSISVQ